MNLNESSHILEHQSPVPYKHIPDTPESSKSDIHHLVSDEEAQDDNKQKSSMPMASFNFINSIIGSGIIGMPFALKEAGFGLGIILIIFVSIITDYSLTLLIHGGELSNSNSYQDVMKAAFGRPGFILLTIVQFLYPMIAMISYNVIIGDTITKIVVRVGGAAVRHTIIARREFIIVAVTLVVTFPLSLYRNIAKLSKTSFVSLVLIGIMMSFIVARVFTMPVHVPQSDDAYEFANTGITKAIGIMAFAYMCHHNSFLLYDSLVQPTEKRWAFVTHISVGFSMACTLVMAIAGYATFTGYSQGDILENYCHDDDLMNAARFMFAITIMLTFPIECFVTREVVENAIFAFEQPSTLWRHIISTVLLVLFSLIVSMTTDCLGIVLELNGVLNAAPLAYIFPALCVMKLQNDRLLCWKNVPSILVASFGFLVSIIGFIMVCIEIANGVTCSHGEEMSYCYKDNAVGGGEAGVSPTTMYLNSSTTART